MPVFQAALAAQNAGRLDEARALYQQIPKQDPRHFDALCQLAIVAFQQGDYAGALRENARALRVNPKVAGLHNNSGTFLQRLGRHAEAAESFGRAVALDPTDAQAHNNRGVALHKIGRAAEALASIDRAIALKPDYAKAHSDRAYVLTALGRTDEAIEACDRALALRPDAVEAHDNRGVALVKAGRYDEALASFDRALAVQPDYAFAHRNRGGVLELLRRQEEAATSLAAAVAYDPSIELAAGNLLLLKMQICDWRDYDETVATLLKRVDAGQLASTPFPLQSIPSSLAQQRQVATLYVPHVAPPAAPALPRKARGDKIRIGYFSADFGDHPVGHAIAGVLEAHDRTRFEIAGFSIAARAPDAYQQRIRNAFDRFVDVRPLSDSAAAHEARDLGIDIAVDLNGYTTGSRAGIFAHRAAPVQIVFLGYAGTMGASFIDYLIADPIVVPKEHRRHYAEKIIHLPHSAIPADSTRPIAPHPFTRAELGLPAQGVVFCAFNNAYKITPHVFAIWMRLLSQIDGSVLWLSVRNPTAQNNLRKEAETRGVSPNRLVFNTPMDLPAHLARHAVADIFLDSFPYGAHSTAIDALWGGLPVLTKLGETYAGRVAASALTAVGLPELIAPDVQAYEQAALSLARNPARIADLKSRLAANKGSFPLFDTARFARHIEAAYRQIWERYHQGIAPEHCRVEEGEAC